MLTAIRQSGLPQVLSELLTLGQRHVLDIVLAAIACWAVVKLHRRPRQLWWFLAAIALTYVPGGISRALFEGFRYLSPGLTTAGAMNAVGQAVGGVMELSFMVVQGLVWWCVLEAAYFRPNDSEGDDHATPADESL